MIGRITSLHLKKKKLIMLCRLYLQLPLVRIFGWSITLTCFPLASLKHQPRRYCQNHTIQQEHQLLQTAMKKQSQVTMVTKSWYEIFKQTALPYLMVCLDSQPAYPREKYGWIYKGTTGLRWNLFHVERCPIKEPPCRTDKLIHVIWHYLRGRVGRHR